MFSQSGPASLCETVILITCVFLRAFSRRWVLIMWTAEVDIAKTHYLMWERPACPKQLCLLHTPLAPAAESRPARTHTHTHTHTHVVIQNLSSSFSHFPPKWRPLSLFNYICRTQLLLQCRAGLCCKNMRIWSQTPRTRPPLVQTHIFTSHTRRDVIIMFCCCFFFFFV